MHQTRPLHPALPATTDPRWSALSTVQAARTTLGLRDRDIAVLRGLLTFIPPDRWDGPLMVFASNAALSARCDGMDERTLRRRLAHLCAIGLIERHQSPNRKRYVIRDEAGAAVLTYGFCLTPLRTCLRQLQDMAAREKALSLRIRALKARLRHLVHGLMQAARLGADEMAALLRMLRRKMSETDLTAAIRTLEAREIQPETVQNVSDTAKMTANDSQNDRHIQNQKKENDEIEQAASFASVEEGAERAEKALTPRLAGMTVDLCLEAAPNAHAFSPHPPKDWRDLVALAETLAPAIGVDAGLWRRCLSQLGPQGAALAILGLVEAYPRIKAPPRYLGALLARAQGARIDVVRMFRSLTGWARFPAGNPA